MKNILLCLMLQLVVFPSIAQNYEKRLFPLSENGKKYYVDIFGERITESIYDDDWSSTLEDNETGWIVVKRNDMYGIIDIHGREIVPCAYQDLDAVNKNNNFGNLLRCKKNEKYGIITIENKEVVPFIYDNIQPFLLDNNIIMCCKNGKWGAIKAYTWKTVIPFEYDDYNGCFEYNNNLLCVRKGEGHNGYINTKGEVVIPLEHSTGWFFKDDEYTVFQNSKTGIWYSYNDKGKKVEIGKYDEVKWSYENRILVRENGKYGFVNSETGKLVIPCIYDGAHPFNDGVALVTQKNKGKGYALISKTGELLSDFILTDYHSKYYVKDGLFTNIGINGKWGSINKNGKLVIPFEYDELWDFNEKGYAQFKKDGKWGVINKINNIIIPATYDNIRLSSECELIAANKAGKWGYVNLSNQIVVPFSYDEAYAFGTSEEFASVYKNGNVGYIDRKGNLVVQCGESNADLKKCQYLYSQAPSDVDINIPNGNINNGKSFVLIIANENYDEAEISKVAYAHNDGKIFMEYCKKVLGVSNQNIKFIEDATINNMRMGLNWLNDRACAFDGQANIIVYYSGHGIPDEQTNQAYLLPSDGIANDYRSAYSISDMYKQLGDMPTKLTTVFLDACFSGTSKEGNMLLKDSKGVIVKSKQESPKGNMVVMSAAQGNETAFSYKKKKHSMFTYFLLKKLQETKGHVSLGELGNYVNQQVRQHSVQEVGKSQTPTINISNKLSTNWKSITLK